MPSYSRRNVIRTCGVAGVVALAGCGGGDGDGDGDVDGDGNGDGDDGTGGDGTDGGNTDGGPDLSGTVRIGHLEPLSGSFAATGVPAQQAADLAAERLNAEDGAGGAEIEMVHRDTELDPDTAVTRARELVQNEDVDVVAGLLSSAAALGVAEFCASADVPMITSMAQTPDLTGPECQATTFRTSTNVDQFAEGLAQTVDENLDVTRVAGCNPDYNFGQQMWEAFKTRLLDISSDYEIVDELFPALGKGNYQNEIQQLLSVEPDAVMTSMYGGDVVSFIQQGRDYDLFNEVDEFIQGSGSIHDTMRALGENAPTGIANCHYYHGWPDTEMERNFVEGYRESYDNYPTGGAAEAYSSVQLVKHAVEDAGSIETDDLIDAMEGLEWESPEGTKQIREQDHECTQPVWQGRLGEVDHLDFPGMVEMYSKDVHPDPDGTCQ